MRLVLGLLIAALWLPVLLYIQEDVGLFWFFVVSVYTIPLTIFVAIPTYFIFRKHISLLMCVGMGGVIGVIGSLIFFFTTNLLAAMNWAPALILTGIISSVIFWIIAIWKNEKLTRYSMKIK